MCKILGKHNVHSSDLLPVGDKRDHFTVAFEQDRTGQRCVSVCVCVCTRTCTHEHA